MDTIEPRTFAESAINFSGAKRPSEAKAVKEEPGRGGTAAKRPRTTGRAAVVADSDDESGDIPDL